ncbi:MAG TPA: TatD family hydrolase [Candidatus Saccharimonadales bacterium]|nr:TatD family hydrolase [Candidatus Saccharimonadales bacterium]
MTIEFIDTHCHIQSAGDGAGATAGERITREKWAKLGRSGDEIVAKATEYGVSRLVCVGCDVPDSRLAVGFVQDRPGTWASIGIHPHEAGRYVGTPAALDEFAALAERSKVVAVGECGLDYYYEHSRPEQQAEILRFQLDLAGKHDLPVIFHVRGASMVEQRKDAFRDFWPIFDEFPGIRGVLHSFTDTAANLEKALERGLYIGVNGIATFVKDPAQLDMYKNIPLSRLLLETDAPYLTPTPYRGTICESYHISVIADFLGGLRQEPLTDLARATTENAVNLFNLTEK